MYLQIVSSVDYAYMFSIQTRKHQRFSFLCQLIVQFPLRHTVLHMNQNNCQSLCNKQLLLSIIKQLMSLKKHLNMLAMADWQMFKFTVAIIISYKAFTDYKSAT